MNILEKQINNFKEFEKTENINFVLDFVSFIEKYQYFSRIQDLNVESFDNEKKESIKAYIEIKKFKIPIKFKKLTFQILFNKKESNFTTYEFIKEFINNKEDIFDNYNQELNFFKTITSKTNKDDSSEVFNNIFILKGLLDKNIVDIKNIFKTDLENSHFHFHIAFLDYLDKNKLENNYEKYSQDFIGSYISFSNNKKNKTWNFNDISKKLINNDLLHFFIEGIKKNELLFSKKDQKIIETILLNDKLNNILEIKSTNKNFKI